MISGTTPAAAGTNEYPYQGAACWSTGGTSGYCANSGIAKVAPDGTITVYASATYLITDINGYWTN